jgi:hypothetical protein
MIELTPRRWPWGLVPVADHPVEDCPGTEVDAVTGRHLIDLNVAERTIALAT